MVLSNQGHMIAHDYTLLRLKNDTVHMIMLVRNKPLEGYALSHPQNGHAWVAYGCMVISSSSSRCFIKLCTPPRHWSISGRCNQVETQQAMDPRVTAWVSVALQAGDPQISGGRNAPGPTGCLWASVSLASGRS